MLVLDAGNALLGESLALKSEGRVIVEAMNAMGYDAMTVGLMDLAKGVDTLLARREEARFAVLSGNIVRKESGATLFEPYTVIVRGGVRFGIIGMSEPEVVQAPGAADVIAVQDPAQTMARLLPEVQAQSDVVIVLSHLGLERDRELAAKVPGIDVIVGGYNKILLEEPEFAANTILVQMGYDGEWLGALKATLLPEGGLSEPQVTSIALDPAFAENPVVQGIVEEYEREYPDE
ncbi:MAG: bifunctional UDP-sugar hydrolase/5'-nucleotidase [Anaerolineae bacterium]